MKKTMVEKRKGTNCKKSDPGMAAVLMVLLMGCIVLAEAQVTKSGDKRSSRGSGGLEQEVTVTMPIPGIQFTSCEAYISLQSHQRNTLARVVSTIEQKTCKTSTGEYELHVTLKDENGTHQTLKFNEIWEQNDASEVEFSNDYPIGENVTLKRVMAQGLRCECSDE